MGGRRNEVGRCKERRSGERGRIMMGGVLWGRGSGQAGGDNGRWGWGRCREARGGQRGGGAGSWSRTGCSEIVTYWGVVACNVKRRTLVSVAVVDFVDDCQHRLYLGRP